MIWLAMGVVLMAGDYGTPKIAKFKGSAVAAVSMQFDDSMNSQLANAVPLLNARKLRSTFFINPGRKAHQDHRTEWEVDLPRAGHELANHTMNHIGTRDEAELAKEIAECSKVIDRIHGRNHLGTFGQPGGVPWNITPEQLDRACLPHRLVPALTRTFFDEKTDPIVFVEQARREGTWLQLGFHGVGGEWLSTDVPVFTKLVDYLAAHRESLWIAPTNEVVKYQRERDAARSPVLSAVSESGFEVRVDCDASKLETYGLPFEKIYDEPLTVEVPVPASWRTFEVSAGSRRVRGTTVMVDGKRVVRVDVRPNAGSVRVRKD